MPTPNTEYCHKSTCTEIPKFKLGQCHNRRRARPLGCFRVGAASSLASVSRAGGFDEACGFAMLLARIRIFDELK